MNKMHKFSAQEVTGALFGAWKLSFFSRFLSTRQHQ